MTAQECITTRRSVRKFADKKVPREVLAEAFEMARYAPSWKNTQTARYTVVEGEKKEVLAQAAFKDFAKNITNSSTASALIVVSTVTGLCGYNPDGSFTTPKGDRWQTFDAGIATQTLCLALHSLGVGSVIMGIFDEDAVKEMVGLPENEIVSTVIAVGYPEGDSICPRRKELEEIVRYI